MIRTFVAALLASLFIALPLHAQVHLYDSESLDVKLEFIRNLRKKPGYLPLVKEYTDELLAKADKESSLLLQLENARTGVEMAKDQKPELRLQMIDKARLSFEPFIKNNPKSQAGAQARAEMARVYSMQALMRLNKAFAGEPGEERLKGAAEARRLYDAADAEYIEAIKTLKELKKDVVQAEFDRGNNMLEKADAFINLEDSGQNRQRAQTVAEAIKLFSEIAKDKESVNGLLANAYLVKCYQEGQDPPKIAEHLNVVNSATGAKAIPAQMLAFYYDILYVKTVPNFNGDRMKSLYDRSNEWLKAYPTARKSYHGEHLRFEQTIYLFSPWIATGFEPDKMKKAYADPKQKAALDQSLVATEKIANELEKDGGDFSERASYVLGRVRYVRLIIGGKEDDFETAILRVNEKIRQAVKALEDKKTAEAEKYFHEVHTLIASAVRIGEKSNVPPSKLHEAQFLLGQAYGAVNDLPRAAIAYEMLARANPPSNKAAEAAVQAVQLYKRFADEDKDESARYYLRELGTFVLEPSRQKLWAGQPAVAIARYCMAHDYMAEEKYKESLEQFANIPKDFPGFIYSQGEAVMCALKAREKAEAPEEKKAWTGEAKKAIDRMGPLPATADPSTALIWFLASCEAPKFLYAEATELLKNGKDAEAASKYAQMGSSIAALRAAFAKEGGKVSEERRKQIGFTIEVLEKYKDLGAADVAYKKGDYEAILKDDLLGAVAKEILDIAKKLDADVKDPKAPKAKIKVKDVGVVGDSLSLVLRSFVQMGNLPAATGVYGLLLRLDSEEGGADRSANFTRILIEDLKQQVKTMKEANDAAKLKDMRGKFVPFADALAKTLIVEKKTPEIGDINNMVQFYVSLDEFKKAGDLIKSIPEPKFLEPIKGAKNPPKLTEDQEKELYIYWHFQVENGKLMRLSKDFKTANTVLNRIINHENARMQTVAEFELVEMYIDMEQYGTAIKLIGGLMEKLRRADPGKNQKVKEMYFEGFYKNTYAIYKYSQTPKVKQDGKDVKYLALAASQIVNLENAPTRDGWLIAGPKFQELLEREKTLKEAYEKAKVKAK